MVREMKHTEIGDIPADWEVQTFEETFRVLSNNTLSRAELNDRGGSVRNVHYGDILTRFTEVLDCSDEDIPFLNDASSLTASAMPLQDGDIILADTAEDETVGKATEIAGLGDKKLVSGLHTIPCRVKKGDFAPGWLGYYMNSHAYHDQVLPYVTGIKVSSISKAAIAETLVLIPPKDEQKAISSALAEMDVLIFSLKKKIKKKRDMLTGMHQELINGKYRLKGFRSNWVKANIGKMTTVSAGGTPSTSVKEYWGGNIPWMNSGELNMKIVREVEGRITDLGLENSSTHMVPAKCVLIGLAGQGKTRGTAAYNTFPLCTNQSIAAICPNDELFDSKFLYYYMDSQYEKLRELSSGGGGRGGLNKKLLEEYEVFMPSDVSEQRAIAEILTDAETELEELNDKCDKYKAIKQGMMSELLTGKVRLM